MSVIAFSFVVSLAYGYEIFHLNSGLQKRSQSRIRMNSSFNTLDKLPLPTNVRKTMKAALAKSYGAKLSLDEVETPKPGQNQVLVEIYSSGLCHTDIHAIDGDWAAKAPLPLIPGLKFYTF